MKTIKRCNELYELWTGLYMLDAWEKGLWNSVIVAFFAITSYYVFKSLGLGQN